MLSFNRKYSGIHEQLILISMLDNILSCLYLRFNLTSTTVWNTYWKSESKMFFFFLVPYEKEQKDMAFEAYYFS